MIFRFSPFHPLQGDARDFKDVCCQLAERMGMPLGFESGEQFVEQACKLTTDVKKKARGFKGMKKTGVWHDAAAEPAYRAYRKRVAAALDGHGSVGEPGLDSGS